MKPSHFNLLFKEIIINKCVRIFIMYVHFFMLCIGNRKYMLFIVYYCAKVLLYSFFTTFYEQFFFLLKIDVTMLCHIHTL